MNAEKNTSSKEEVKELVERLFTICTTLSHESLRALSRCVSTRDDFKGTLPRNYIVRSLLGHLLRIGFIYESSPHFYTIAGRKEDKEKFALDAVWVLIQNLNDVDLHSIMRGPRPAQITYIKNNRIYHIVRCKGAGIVELSMASQLEIATEQHRRVGEKTVKVEERFFIIFDGPESANQAPFHLNAKSLFTLMTYKDGSRVPNILWLEI